MTRIFGYKNMDPTAQMRSNSTLIDNLEEAIEITYQKDGYAYGLGFIVITTENEVKTYSIYKGYKGILPSTQIETLFPKELIADLDGSPKTVFGVLQNNPDDGAKGHESHKGWKFPLESEHWYVITIGRWWNKNFTDQKESWYHKARPSISILNYLETNPQEIDFSWIDPKRIAYIIAVSKKTGEVIISDSYSENNGGKHGFLVREENGLVEYLGIRDPEGNQV